MKLFGTATTSYQVPRVSVGDSDNHSPAHCEASSFQRKPRNKKLFGLFICAAVSVLANAPGVMAQRAPVNLGTAGNYVILTKTGITSVPPAHITGNIGASPITGAAVGVTCAEVTGTISVVDAAGPAPCSLVVPGLLTTAISDMETAYTDAAGRTIPDYTELYAGNISGKTLLPGLYKWSTNVLMDATGVTLSGGPNAVWIFQIAGDLNLANGAHIYLAGGASANNIFWQVGGPIGATLGTTTVFNGTILSAKQVIMNTGATLNGRALAQTQATLQSTTVTSPGTLVGGIPVPFAPAVTSTVPTNLATNVATNTKLSATFNEVMDPATINSPSLTFTLKNGVVPIAGTVAYSGITATFAPTATLPAGTLLTATITTGAKDPVGVALSADYVWTFTTGAGPDITPPTVSFTVPAAGANNVPTTSALAATFSKPMDPSTINAVSFSLKQGLVPVTGVVSYSGITATFTPTVALANSTVYTATITSAAKDLAGNAMVSDYVWSFLTGAAPDTTPPTVTFTAPASGAINVPAGNALSATFSEAMDPSTIGVVAFQVKQGSTSVAGSVTYAGITAVFTPATALTANTLTTATITTFVKDLAGNAMASNYVWTFTTGTGPDITPPLVSFTFPASGATNIGTRVSLAATFTKAMDPSSISNSTFTLKQGSSAISGVVTLAGLTAVFRPLVSLAPGTLFTATISTGAKDLAGNALATAYTWSFTTGAGTDTTAPTVLSTFPASGSTFVTLSTSLIANFSESMDPLTINTGTFLLRQGSTALGGTVSYAGTAATFRPSSPLAANTRYDASITTAASDIEGNPLAATYSWSFTTGSQLTQPVVCLPNFAMLAGTAVISSGASAVRGDIGVSPGTLVSGFPPGTYKGEIHAGDALAAQGMADFLATYASAVGQSSSRVLVSGELGGQTFTAGFYQANSSLAITTGDLTLDAKGNSNAVFLFQTASTLTTGIGRQVILAGGARANNVFWLVGTSATVGSGSSFKGSILADQSITMNSLATIDGKLTARTGSITLQSNTITSPVPEIAQGGIFNSATEARTVAAGSIASVFGNSLGGLLTVSIAYPLPTTLGGSNVQVGTYAAPLFMSSCSQMNVQIPWEAAGQTSLPVSAAVGPLVSALEPVTIAPFAPGIFTLNQTGSGQGAVEIAPTAQLASVQSATGHPVKHGEYVAIFCTGLGAVTNQPATGAAALSNPLSYTTTGLAVSIGGVIAQVTYSGLAPGYAGLYQVNAIVPDTAALGDAVELFLSIGGVKSNSVTIAIQ